MSPFRPMTQFDPSRPALVHDRLNAKTFEWSPEWRASFERYKRDAGLGVVSWDGLLLDGWAPIRSAEDLSSPSHQPAGVPRFSSGHHVGCQVQVAKGDANEGSVNLINETP
jgi:hypothetical protein